MRIVWQTVRRIANEILGVKGLSDKVPVLAWRIFLGVGPKVFLLSPVKGQINQHTSKQNKQIYLTKTLQLWPNMMDEEHPLEIYSRKTISYLGQFEELKALFISG